ncbi:MAG: hypothetical protein ACI80K_004616 [Paracoccaceae bacterium]|jgi:hypothetical protein
MRIDLMSSEGWQPLIRPWPASGQGRISPYSVPISERFQLDPPELAGGAFGLDGDLALGGRAIEA